MAIDSLDMRGQNVSMILNHQAALTKDVPSAAQYVVLGRWRLEFP
jgi:hypothetical protein